MYNFSPLDQFLCPLFKKQRLCFSPVKQCTVKVYIFLICKFSLSNIYFPPRVQSVPKRLDVFNQMMNTITLDLGYMPVEIRVVRGVRTRDSQRFASSGFVGWRYSDTSWKDCVED